jgi:hypothetical protein
LRPSPVYPFTQTTRRNVCPTSTKSRCASITAHCIEFFAP